MSGRKLTREQIAQAVHRYTHTAVSVRDLATEYGLAYASMHGLLRRRGVLDREDKITSMLRVRPRHGHAVLAALPDGLTGTLDEPASGPHHVVLTVGALAVELVDAGWDDTLHAARLRHQITRLPDGHSLLVVWMDRDHRLRPPAVAAHITTLATSTGPSRYAAVWGDGPVIAAGTAADAHHVVAPHWYRPIHC